MKQSLMLTLCAASGRMPELAGRRRAVQRARPGAAAHDLAIVPRRDPEWPARASGALLQIPGTTAAADGRDETDENHPAGIHQKLRGIIPARPRRYRNRHADRDEKTTGKEYIPQQQFDSSKCRYNVPTRIEDYNFVYDKAGWLVESLYYDNNDLELARSSQLDR
jgi:hypothetical protein